MSPQPFFNGTPRTPTRGVIRNNYGAASKFDFDNPQKWHTESQIPLLDEHTMTGEDGSPIADVDRFALQEIANNNNRRVRETGDPATAILGHTSDDPSAPEKPAKGFFVNYVVKPFKRNEQGQVIYALHGDLKVRPQNRHLIEEYPRRSVELWWGKKEIDPIALLGGTTPERDLGAVIRHARLNHVALLGGSPPGRDLTAAIKMDRTRNGTVFFYDTPSRPRRYGKSEDKFGKVMHEFKHGELHSGSKHGPKVTSRDQAKAIAASEAGISKHSREDTDMPHPHHAHGTSHAGEPNMHGMHPHQYNHAGHSMHYDDSGMDTGDMGDDHDSGDDPAVAAVLQSKSFRSMLEEVVMQAIESAMGGGGPAPGGPGMGAEPPPGTGDMGGMPPDGEMGGSAADLHDDGMGGHAPDEEAAEYHGEHPVRFEEDPTMYSSTNFGGSSFPGPMNTFQPSLQSHTGLPHPSKSHKMQRPQHQTGGTPRGPTRGNAQQYGRQQQGESQEVVRLKRQIAGLVMKNSRAEATQIVAQLKAEGLVFGPTPEEAARGEREDINILASLGDQDRDAYVNKIRRQYSRRPANPAMPGQPGVFAFSRQPEGLTPGADEDPMTPEECQAVANIAARQKVSIDEAIKMMRKGEREHAARANGMPVPTQNGSGRRY